MFFTRLTDCREDELGIGASMVVSYEDVLPDLTFPLFRPAK